MYSENKKLKVAFLGGAINSAVGNAHFSALGMDHKFELVAGCFSRDKDRNRITGQQYGIHQDRVYSKLDELLKHEKDTIDAVIILTPTDQHTQQVIQCFESGYPVICEKALANDSNEAIQIKNALIKNKSFLSVIYNYLGYPMLRELKNLIEMNKLGRIQHIQVEMPQEGFIRVSPSGEPIVPQRWRLHDGIIPTVSLDLGVHLHMLVKFLTGEIPLNVVSVSKTFGNFSNIIDNVSSIVEYTNNIICNMWYSKIAIGKRNGMSIRLYGETGSAEWIQENPEYLYLADNKGNRWSLDRGCSEMQVCNQLRYTRFKAGHPAGFIEGYANYYYDISSSYQNFLINKDKYLDLNCFGIDESLEGLQLFEAISRSSLTGTWEKVTP